MLTKAKWKLHAFISILNALEHDFQYFESWTLTKIEVHVMCHVTKIIFISEADDGYQFYLLRKDSDNGVNERSRQL